MVYSFTKFEVPRMSTGLPEICPREGKPVIYSKANLSQNYKSFATEISKVNQNKDTRNMSVRPESLFGHVIFIWQMQLYL